MAELEQVIALRKYTDTGFVTLVDDAEAVSARRSRDGEADIRLPRGTRAFVLSWGRSYLGSDAPVATNGDLTQVLIVNGPLRGERLWVADRAIELE